MRQGEGAEFSVSATHLLPLSFQWQLGGVDLPGATNATLALTNVQPSQAGAYTVIVSNALGIATSEPATLTVLPPVPPEILSQPQSQTVEVGMEVRLSVVATNDLPLTYQWQFNSADIVGATQANLTLPSVGLGDQGEYRVLVRSEYLTTQSDPALLVVKPVEFVPGPGVVTNTSQANLEAAMSSGLPVTFGVNGVIALTNTLVITKDTTLDATGRSITLDGQGSIRHFEVKPQATLRLINLRLVNGRHAGARGSFDEHGQPGLGGSIYNAGGAVELIGCELINNQALGGRGGQFTQASRGKPTDGGPAYGGAVYSVDGRVSAADCVFGQNRCVGGDGTPGLGISPVGGGGGDAHGGAIYVQGGALALTQVTLTNNVAEGGNEFQTRVNRRGGSGIGGAVSVRETDAVFDACVFAANEALGKTRVSTEPIAASGSGGAIFKQQGTMTIADTRFTGNRALGGGGDSPGIETVINGAGNGGAVFNESGVLEIRECALTSNIAKGSDQRGPYDWLSFAGDGIGGAIYNAGELVLINTTLTENRTIGGEGSYQNIAGSAFGGAIYSLEGSASLLNVTVAGNSVQAGKETQSRPNYPPQALGGSIMVTNGTLSLVNTILSCVPPQTNVWSTTAIVDGGHNLSSDASAQFSSTTSQGIIDSRLGPLADNGGLTPTMALLPGSPAIDAGDDSAAPPADQRGLGRPAGAHSDIGAFEVAAPGPLAITTPPADASVDTGQGVSFSVSVSAVPVTYQWQFNGADLPGATNAVLRLDNVQVAQVGEYRVVVSDASGSVTSPAATLTVVPPTAPVILVQPQSQAVRISDPVSLSVVATNVLWLTYQWQHDGADIPGATEPTFEISAVTAADAGAYTVIVSSPFLSTTSASAVVTIDLRPFILTHPADQQVIEGRTAFLSVEADGDGSLAYQWFLDGIAFPGATNSTLTLENIPLTLVGTYTITVRNSSGEITSQPASVSVRPSALDLDFVPAPDLGIWNVSALSVRAGGKVYVGGQASGFRVMSLNGDGSLDTTFTWPDFQSGVVAKVAFYPDESFLAGGGFELVSGVPRRYFARIKSDGRLNGEFVVGYPFDFMIHTMAVQPDGKALIASGPTPVFLRLNQDGSVDPSFTPDIKSQVYRSFVFQADGTIVVQISNQDNTGSLLVRCDAAGIRDRDFLVDFGAPSKLLGIVPLPDGKLLAGGTFSTVNGVGVSANLVRLNPDGSVDQTFNPNVPIPPVLALAVERGGSVLVGVGAPEGVIRLSADGVLDRSFQVNTGPVYAMAVLNDETVLIGGSFQEVDGVPRLGVAKLRLPSSVPQLEGVIRIGPMVRLSMITPPGKTCILEHAESLAGAEWNPVQTVPGDGARHVFADTNALGTEGFYRVRIE
ncbi:MAG: immunoglobulin domain-containing protein [Verrucomicrobiia bacterium]